MSILVMATMLADYVEKRALIPCCAEEVMGRATEQEIRFYFKHIYGGGRNGF